MEDCTLADDDAMAVAAVGGNDDIENGYTLFEKSNIFIVVSANIILMAYCVVSSMMQYTRVCVFFVCTGYQLAAAIHTATKHHYS